MSPNLQKKDDSNLRILQNLTGYGGMITALEKLDDPQKMVINILTNLCDILIKNCHLFESVIESPKALSLFQKLLKDIINSNIDGKKYTTVNRFSQRLNSLNSSADQVLKDINEIKSLAKEINLTATKRIKLLGRLLQFYTLCFNIITVEDDSFTREIYGLLAQGESQSVEFKSTLRWDINKNCKNKELHKPIAKTIAGFMNSNGGHLLIGVDDNSNVIGLEYDFNSFKEPQKDNFRRNFSEIAKKYLEGTDISSCIKGDFHDIEDKIIFSVKVERGRDPVFFIDGEKVEYYVRVQSTTRPFNVREAINHYKAWWQK